MATERWNSVTTIKFTQEFKSYECLWNQKLPIYNNKHARDAVFQKVVEEMNITGFGVPDMKKKMRTLGSTYYQEKKKIQNSILSGSGSDNVYVPNILWFNEMDALLKDVDHRRTIMDNLNNSANNETHDSSFVACDTQEFINENVNITNDNTEIIPEINTGSLRPAAKNVPKRKGIFAAIGELKKLQEVINKDVSNDKEDAFDVFGKSVAMQLRALSFERGMIGQSRIQNILTELSIENYRCNIQTVSSERSTPSFYTFSSESEETVHQAEYSSANMISTALAFSN